MPKTLIQALLSSDYRAAFDLLLEGKYAKNAQTKNGLTALHLAAQKGYDQLLSLMIMLGFDKNAREKNGKTPLHFAVENHHVEATTVLLSKHALVNAKDKNQNTPLHLAITKISPQGFAITRALLKAKANPNALNQAKQSPLHLAVIDNNYPRVRLLIQFNADPYLEDETDYTPIDYASEKKFTRIQNFLETEYIDEEASDTDSEDVTDYQFLDRSPSPSFDTEKVLLTGKINDQAFDFEEQWIIPNGDCAFIGLGTDRASLVKTLRNNATHAIRDLLWKEIADAILVGIYQPEGVDEMLEQYYSHPDEAPQPLQSFCIDRKVFRGYLDLLEDPDKKIWLGYQAAKAYAKIKKIQLYIWTQTDDNTLKLADQSETPEANGEIHLLHTENFSHFNLLMKKENFDDKLNSIKSMLETLSLEKKSSVQSSSSSSSSSVKKEVAIPHFRGVHFYKNYFTREQRKQSVDVHRQQNAGTLPRIGLYSSATYELAEATLSLPEVVTEQTLIELDNELIQANENVVESMHWLQEQQNVDACLGTSKASRKTYSSRYIEFVQRYVNSYQTLMKDLRLAPSKKIDGRSGPRVTAKYETLKDLGFTKLPLLSTSESVYWGLEYASALLNWDKETHEPRKLDAAVLSPCYSADGHARFPYLGILYVTLHAQSALSDKISTRILDLFSDDEIDTKCSSPGGHLKGGYLKARERVFIGGIEYDCVKLSLVFRVPSFYHEFRPFIEEKYGFTKIEYNRFKNRLKQDGSLSSTGTMRNATNFQFTEQEIIQSVITKQQIIIERLISKIAEKENKICRYLGIDGKLTQASPSELEDFIEKKAAGKKRVKN